MIAFVMAVAALVGAPAPQSSAKGTVTEKTFKSEALGVNKAYWIYLPAGYDTSNERYPVIYMLHGLGGGESDWFGGASLAETADRLSLHAIIVTPDGDASFYVNSKKPVDYKKCLASKPEANTEEAPVSYCVRKPRYEDYIVRDLVKHVDKSYRTIAKREARAIGGLSMGGFGALMLAMRYHFMFSAAASHAGVISLLGAPPRRTGDKPTPVKDLAHWGDDLGWGPQVRGIFGKNPSTWRQYDPATLANYMPIGRVAIYLDAGTDDEYHLADAAQLMHDVLEKRHYGHEFTLVPGGRHDTAFWRARAPESLKFFAAHFRRNGV